MRAVVFDGTLTYRDDRPRPVPGAGEALVQVRLAGICATDLHILRGYGGFRGVLGHEMVGTVIEGSNAWKGRRVVSEINCVCRRCDRCQAGLATHCRNRTIVGIQGRDGCFAEYAAVPEANLHAVPDSISDEEAVFVEPLAAAYQILAQIKLDGRTSVTVVGSGRLGLLVAQVLATTGCRLTVIGRNPAKLLLCEKRGITARHLDEVTPQADQDVVVDCSGSPGGLALAMELVRPRGTIVLKTTCADDLVRAEPVNLAPLVVNEVRMIGSRCGPFPEAINALARGAVDVRPLVTARLPLDRGLEAVRLAGAKEHLKVLITMPPA